MHQSYHIPTQLANSKFRFFDGKTQMEVAEEIGILHSEMQYISTRCKDAYKGNYDAVFEVDVRISV